MDAKSINEFKKTLTYLFGKKLGEIFYIYIVEIQKTNKSKDALPQIKNIS